MQSIFDIEDKGEDLYAILNCVDTSSVRLKLIESLFKALDTDSSTVGKARANQDRVQAFGTFAPP